MSKRTSKQTPVFVVFAGLPGVGKSTIAKDLAARTGSFYLRVDTVEQALARSMLAICPAQDAGYVIAGAVASDNLRGGTMVVADSVNPLALTRDAFRAVAEACAATVLEVEVICSDKAEHRRRVETRRTNIPGLKLPTWDRVLQREYEEWTRERLILDTATLSAEECVQQILDRLPIP